MRLSVVLLLFAVLWFPGCSGDEGDQPEPESLEIVSVKVGDTALSLNETISGLRVDQPIIIVFSHEIDPDSYRNIEIYDTNDILIETTASDIRSGLGVSLKPINSLTYGTVYQISILEGLKGVNKEKIVPVKIRFQTDQQALELVSVTINNHVVAGTRITNLETDFELRLEFSQPLSTVTLSENINILRKGKKVKLEVTGNDQSFLIEPEKPLDNYVSYDLRISDELTSIAGGSFKGYQNKIYTRLDSTSKYPEIPDEDLLTLIQQQTFKYFWDFGHAVSGLTRERNSSGDLVTSGGTGFGMMAVLVGIENEFITRNEGIQRLSVMVNFLGDSERFHGAWPHWLNGNSGQVIPFSDKDNGADLVETSYLAMGMITVRQFLDPAIEQERILMDKINELIDSIEWNWFTKQNEQVLYWHWSPQFEWDINLRIQGYNEALITYILAAGSENHGIEKFVYDQGWAGSGSIRNGNTYYDISLPLGVDFGGPLFFSQYTFTGLDPRGLSDQYGDYFLQGQSHSLINQAHCIDNPGKFIGYHAYCWGLTASDNQNGYSAHSPTNDIGVITPTAAISSIIYTPEESMNAIRYFYYILGDKLWGDYGFYDAFNVSSDWVADSYLAIDQGPIILMIENYKTQLLWELFMSAPEVKNGLEKLDFNY